MPKTFDEELTELIERGRIVHAPIENIEAAVAELHRKHGRTVPPPITGTVTLTEPKDGFK